MHLVKLSVEDARWLTGATEPDDIMAAAQSWLDEGPQGVVLTKGAEGMSLITSAGVDVTVPTAPTKVVDTVGAGDTVQGAVLAWLVCNRVKDVSVLSAGDCRDMLEFAASRGRTVSRSGAEPPTAEELRKRV